MPRRFARENFTSGRRRRPISSSMLKVPIDAFGKVPRYRKIYNGEDDKGECVTVEEQ